MTRLMVALALAALALAGTGCGSDGERGPVATTSTVSSTTTTSVVSTTTSASAPDVSAAVFPDAGGTTRFADPVEAARRFAVDFLGLVDPVVGSFQAGDSRSGEIAVRPRADGPVTTVLLRMLDEHWWVLGSATDNIRVQEPAALTSVSSPVRLRGTSTAFEANVAVEVRADGSRRPIATSYVMGGSMGDMGPFDGRVSFAPPPSSMGAVVLFTLSMENGQVWEASVVRVRFAPLPACPAFSVQRPDAMADDMAVTVFYSCDVDADPSATYRLAPRSAGVLRASLDALLAGPTATERAAGLDSWFSSRTTGMVAGVEIRSGRATVDFHDLRPAIPNASASAGSHLLLSQLDATVFQFPSVSSVVYRIDGDCQAFTEWLQIGGCAPRTR